MCHLIVCLLLLLAASISSAEDKWIRLQTENFEIFTPQSEKKAKETALYFEQLRDFFLTYWHTKADPGTPVRIILFGNEKQYEPFRPHKKAAGFFQHGLDRDWIVLSGYLPGGERLVSHEYTHLMIRQMGLGVPIWLNEGLAELYSTFKPVGGKIQVGDLIPGHFQAVQEGWIPVQRLLEIKHDSPEYNGTKTAQFYAQSWGLTHMLILQDQKKESHAALLAKLVGGSSAEEALAAAQLTTKILDEDLRIYLKRNDRFYASVIPFHSTKSDAKWSVERISPGEVDSTLALLQVASSKAGNDAQPRLAKLDPSAWRSQEALAYGAWRKGDMAVANSHFQQAIQLGATSAKLYYDAAKVAMYSGDKNQESVAYLQKAIELYPEWLDAKLQLLEQFLFVGSYAKAAELTKTFKSIGPKEASRLFRGIAYADAMVSGSTPAQIASKRAKDYAKTEFDRAECTRLDSFLDRVQLSEKSGMRDMMALSEQVRGIRERADKDDAASFDEAARRELDLDRPVIRRKGSQNEVGEGGGSVHSSAMQMARPTDSVEFTGTLLDMNCGATFPVVRLAGDNGEVIELEIRDPSRVNLQLVQSGEAVKQVELNCGKQKRKVKVTYGPLADEALKPGEKKLGQLHSIQYLQPAL